LDGERVVVYPDKVYMRSQAPNGVEYKTVVTPDLNYQVSGKMTSALPLSTLENVRAAIKNESAYEEKEATYAVLQAKPLR
jgi:hypothetical protein